MSDLSAGRKLLRIERRNAEHPIEKKPAWIVQLRELARISRI